MVEGEVRPEFGGEVEVLVRLGILSFGIEVDAGGIRSEIGIFELMEVFRG